MENKIGDKRPNSGAPKKENKAKIRAMRFTDEEWQALTKLGRAKWIREQIKRKLEAV